MSHVFMSLCSRGSWFRVSSVCWRVALRVVARVSWPTGARGLVTPGWYRADGGLKPRPPRSVYSGTVTSVITPLMPWCRGSPLVP
jgi:hypothetical protein